MKSIVSNVAKGLTIIRKNVNDTLVLTSSLMAMISLGLIIYSFYIRNDPNSHALLFAGVSSSITAILYDIMAFRKMGIRNLVMMHIWLIIAFLLVFSWFGLK